MSNQDNKTKQEEDNFEEVWNSLLEDSNVKSFMSILSIKYKFSMKNSLKGSRREDLLKDEDTLNGMVAAFEDGLRQGIGITCALGTDNSQTHLENLLKEVHEEIENNKQEEAS